MTKNTITTMLIAIIVLIALLYFSDQRSETKTHILVLSNYQGEQQNQTTTSQLMERINRLETVLKQQLLRAQQNEKSKKDERRPIGFRPSHMTT